MSFIKKISTYHYSHVSQRKVRFGKAGETVFIAVSISIAKKVLLLYLACEDGYALETGTFTSPNLIYYWNIPYFALIQSLRSGYIFIYAEMKTIFVSKHQQIKQGQIIGLVGKVINSNKLSIFFTFVYSKNCCKLELFYALPCIAPIPLQRNKILSWRELFRFG